MSPPTLVTIPRELRQHIFWFAIEDAANEDLKLNAMLRKLVNRIFDPKLLHLDRYTKFEGLLRCNSYHEGEYKLTEYAPNMCAVALAVRSALPELEEDVNFVLENALSEFEEENENARGKGLDEAWRILWISRPGLAAHYAKEFPRGLRMRPLM